MRKILPFVLLLLLPRCGNDSSDPTTANGDGSCPVDALPAENGCIIDERFAVFVDGSAKPGGAGTRSAPFRTITEGITRGETDRKRVYVCAGSYREHLTIRPAVSLFGYFDCSNGWTPGQGRARVTEQGVVATASDLHYATRIEGFEIVAEDATAASGNAIAFVASNAPDLLIVNTLLSGGNGKAGAAGQDAAQLENEETTDDANSIDGVGLRRMDGAISEGYVTLGVKVGVSGTTCSLPLPSGGAYYHGVATNACIGVPGGKAVAGGPGGAPGHGAYFLKETSNWSINKAAGDALPQTATTMTAGVAEVGKEGQVGSSGKSGLLGVLSSEGFVVASGEAAADGQPGQGGGGANGGTLPGGPHPDTTCYMDPKGGGGGAGGCPGLAGTPGGGGGASIGLVAIESPLHLVAVTLVGKIGGDGAKGGFGSFGRPGGLGGKGFSYSDGSFPPNATQESDSGENGGRGGNGGSGGHGAGGPSIALAYRGARPILDAATSLESSKGGIGIGPSSKKNPNGPDELSIPASANGIAEKEHAF